MKILMQKQQFTQIVNHITITMSVSPVFDNKNMAGLFVTTVLKCCVGSFTSIEQKL